MADVKPWYSSRTIWGALVAVAASVGGMLGVPVDLADQAELTDLILQAVSLGGAALALYGRMAATSRIL